MKKELDHCAIEVFSCSSSVPLEEATIIIAITSTLSVIILVNQTIGLLMPLYYVMPLLALNLSNNIGLLPMQSTVS